MRIGFDLRRMHNTGIGRYARNIFAAVTTEAPEHEWIAVVQSDEHAAEVRAFASSARKLRCVISPAAQYTTREMLRTPDVGAPLDLWHSPHPFQLALGARHRTVLTQLDLIQVTHAIGARNLVLREPIRAFIRLACLRADSFVAISAATRDEFRRHMGVRTERVRVTPLAPDPRFRDSVGAAAIDAARKRWDLPARVLLYVGMSQPHKNLDRLLQALALLARERPDEPLALAIIGPNVPAEREALLARIQSLGVGDRVRFLNWLSDEDVRVAYHLADVVVQPSLVEGFGLTVLEAMQCGTATVASDIPAFREVTGGATVLVDPLSPASIAQGLMSVLDDRVLATRLIERGRKHAATFSWRITAKETLEAYELALMAGGGRRRTDDGRGTRDEGSSAGVWAVGD
jgi:glycosyltransferase involved in cell wall biosynthesis